MQDCASFDMLWSWNRENLIPEYLHFADADLLRRLEIDMGILPLPNTDHHGAALPSNVPAIDKQTTRAHVALESSLIISSANGDTDPFASILSDTTSRPGEQPQHSRSASNAKCKRSPQSMATVILCTIDGCDKPFLRQGDLNKHVKAHEPAVTELSDDPRPAELGLTKAHSPTRGDAFELQ